MHRQPAAAPRPQKLIPCCPDFRVGPWGNGFSYDFDDFSRLQRFCDFDFRHGFRHSPQTRAESPGNLPGNEPTKVYNVPSPLGTPGGPKPLDSRAFAGLEGPSTGSVPTGSSPLKNHDRARCGHSARGEDAEGTAASRLRRPSRRGAVGVATRKQCFRTTAAVSQRRDRVEGPCMATEGFFNGLPGRGFRPGLWCTLSCGVPLSERVRRPRSRCASIV